MLSVKPLNLNDEQKDKLVKSFLEEINTAKSARSKMEEQWKTAVRQYNGRLEREGVQPPQANMDIGLTREYCQQSSAALLNPINQQAQYFISLPRAPQFEDSAIDIDEALDYICDTVKFNKFLRKYVKTAQVFHYTIAKVSWIVKKRKIREYVWVEKPVMDPLTGMPAYTEMPAEDGMLRAMPVTERVLEEQEVEVEDLVGAVPEVLPCEDAVFPSDARDIESARWFDHQFHLSKLELRKRLKKDPDGVSLYEGPLTGAHTEDIARPDFAIEEKKLVGLDISKENVARLHEVYSTIGELRIMLDDDKFEEEYDDDCEVILTIDETNKTYRRGVHNWFHSYPRPFVPWSYEGRDDSIVGISQCYILEPHHRTYSAMVCQELDAQSAANETILFGNSGSDAAKVFKNGRLRGGFYEIIGDPREQLAQFNVSQPRTSSGELRAEIQSHMERLANKGPFSFAQVTTSHIAATGQRQQMQEAAQPLYEILESLRGALQQIAYIMLSRYKQFYPDGFPFFLREQDEAGQEVLTPKQIKWPEGAIEASVYVETKVSSTSMNKDLKKQEKLALAEKIPQILSTLKSMVEEMLMKPQLAPTIQKLLAAYQTAIADMYEEFELPNAEILNPDLSQEVNIGQQIQGLLGQLQQLGQENAQVKAQLQGLTAAIQGIPPGPGGPNGPGPAAPPPGPGGPPMPPPPPQG